MMVFKNLLNVLYIIGNYYLYKWSTSFLIINWAMKGDLLIVFFHFIVLIFVLSILFFRVMHAMPWSEILYYHLLTANVLFAFFVLYFSAAASIATKTAFYSDSFVELVRINWTFKEKCGTLRSLLHEHKSLHIKLTRSQAMGLVSLKTPEEIREAFLLIVAERNSFWGLLFESLRPRSVIIPNRISMYRL